MAEQGEGEAPLWEPAESERELQQSQQEPGPRDLGTAWGIRHLKMKYHGQVSGAIRAQGGRGRGRENIRLGGIGTV